MEVAIVSNTPVACCGFIRFDCVCVFVCVPALGPFTLARQTMNKTKEKINFFHKKRKYNDYNNRTGKKKMTTIK